MKSPRKLRFALIGAGARGLAFASHIQRHGDHLAVVYDTDKARLAPFARLSNCTFAEAGDILAVFDDRSLDAVIIASPDLFHSVQLQHALACSQNVYCEKPLAVNIEDLRELNKRRPAASSSVVICGLVLRFHLFYQKLFDLAEHLGRIELVEAADLLQGAFYFRRWHRMRRYSGGLVCHEGIHTFDIVRALVNGSAATISARGRLVRFAQNLAASNLCRDCGLVDCCNEFFDFRSDPLFELYNTQSKQMNSPRDLCVFNSEKDTSDIVTANVFFDGGPIFNYSLCLTSARRTRLFRVIGEKGILEGDETASTWTLTLRGQGLGTKHSVVTPTTLFGGADDECFDHFRIAVQREQPDPSFLESAIGANVLTLAAELSSLRNGSPVRTPEDCLPSDQSRDPFFRMTIKTSGQERF